jgi:hypothetical protein
MCRFTKLALQTKKRAAYTARFQDRGRASVTCRARTGATRGRRRLGFGFSRLAAATLEIGGIPAAAFEGKPGGGDLLGIIRLAARRAYAQRRVRNFQHFILSKTAGRTFVSINRHKNSPTINRLRDYTHSGAQVTNSRCPAGPAASYQAKLRLPYTRLLKTLVSRNSA